MRRLALPAAALAAALAVSACGSTGGGLIPQASANQLSNDLTNIQVAVDEGDCAATTTNIASARTHFENVSPKVNARLRQQLLTGFEALVGAATRACRQNGGSTSTTATTTTSTTTSSTTTSTTTTSSTSSAATTSSSSAATTTSSTSSAATTSSSSSAATTGPTCTPITTPNGGTVCEGTGSTNGVGAAGTGGAGN